MKIILIRIFSLLFFLQTTIPPVLAAEQLGLPAPDVEPPTIVFDQYDTEIEAGIKTFTAAVSDNIGVANVTLYYKGATDVAFRTKTMKESPTDPNIYTVELSLDPVISDKLEIYIRADDVSGNSIFEGQKFSPLTFTIVPVSVPVAAGVEVSQPVTEPAAPEEEEGLATWQWVLIGLGVAALAGGGGSTSAPPLPLLALLRLPGRRHNKTCLREAL
ncbi:MAG: hypothetical protein GY814_06860 [Gammaproteobacteria bacterium]|nr:hypothetical protein [Gammaproteobacteria bacterium]